MNDDDCEAVSAMTGMKTGVLRETALSTKKITCDLNRARSRTAAVGIRRLTARATTRPYSEAAIGPHKMPLQGKSFGERKQESRRQ
jgi:hypothetical protein